MVRSLKLNGTNASICSPTGDVAPSGLPDAAPGASAPASLMLVAGQDLLQFMQEAQQLRAQALVEMTRAWSAAISDVANARSLQELLLVEGRVAGEQFVQLMQCGTLIFDRWVGARARLLGQIPGLMNGEALAADRFAAEGVSAALDTSPFGMMRSVGSTMSRLTQQWVDAVRSGTLVS